MNQINKHNSYLDAAHQIGINICKHAIKVGNAYRWISAGHPLHKPDELIYSALSADFYNGSSGVSYFLTHLYQATKDTVIKDFALGSILDLQNTKHQFIQDQSGLYTGYSGVALALYNAGEVFQRSDFFQEADQLLLNIRIDEGKDVINGSIGAVPLICRRYRETKKEEWLDLAKRIIDYTLKQAQRNLDGLSWVTIKDSTKNLTGLAHGNAGFAWCIAELIALTDDTQLKDDLSQIIQYENKCKSVDGENWSDFRDFEHRLNPEDYHVSGALAWCHGAPGIGLTRLRMHELNLNLDILHDIQTACNTTSKTIYNQLKNKNGSFSICHGLMGNADLLIYHDQIMSKPIYADLLEEVAKVGIEQFLVKDISFPSGLHQMQKNISFMLGDAGIGWFYLRMAGLIKTPSLFGI